MCLPLFNGQLGPPFCYPVDWPLYDRYESLQPIINFTTKSTQITNRKNNQCYPVCDTNLHKWGVFIRRSFTFWKFASGLRNDFGQICWFYDILPIILLLVWFNVAHHQFYQLVFVWFAKKKTRSQICKTKFD